jgi:hypothetical protein
LSWDGTPVDPLVSVTPIETPPPLFSSRRLATTVLLLEPSSSTPASLVPMISLSSTWLSFERSIQTP